MGLMWLVGLVVLVRLIVLVGLVVLVVLVELVGLMGLVGLVGLVGEAGPDGDGVARWCGWGSVRCAGSGRIWLRRSRPVGLTGRWKTWPVAIRG